MRSLASARAVLTFTSRLSGITGLPASSNRLKKRNKTCAGVCSTTNVPRPCRRTTSPSDARSPIALRAVPWLTPNSAAISNSLAMSWPGFHSPERMRSIRRSRTWA